MTAQLSEYGQDPYLTLYALSVEGEPVCFGGKELYVQEVSKGSVQSGDRVLTVSYHVINDVGYEASVEVFTVTQDPCEDIWGIQLTKAGTTQSIREIPENCFKILNPEVYEDGRIPIVASESFPISSCFKILHPEVLE